MEFVNAASLQQPRTSPIGALKAKLFCVVCKEEIQKLSDIQAVLDELTYTYDLQPKRRKLTDKRLARWKKLARYYQNLPGVTDDVESLISELGDLLVDVREKLNVSQNNLSPMFALLNLTMAFTSRVNNLEVKFAQLKPNSHRFVQVSGTKFNEKETIALEGINSMIQQISMMPRCNKNLRKMAQKYSALHVQLFTRKERDDDILQELETLYHKFFDTILEHKTFIQRMLNPIRSRYNQLLRFFADSDTVKSIDVDRLEALKNQQSTLIMLNRYDNLIKMDRLTIGSDALVKDRITEFLRDIQTTTTRHAQIELYAKQCEWFFVKLCDVLKNHAQRVENMFTHCTIKVIAERCLRQFNWLGEHESLTIGDFFRFLHDSQMQELIKLAMMRDNRLTGQRITYNDDYDRMQNRINSLHFKLSQSISPVNGKKQSICEYLSKQKLSTYDNVVDEFSKSLLDDKTGAVDDVIQQLNRFTNEHKTLVEIALYNLPGNINGNVIFELQWDPRNSYTFTLDVHNLENQTLHVVVKQIIEAGIT